ncbi:pre-B-cell leukemia transcription factor-interacting protein 1 isoform X2 [Lepisosteus oculatus]|uniref:pre-B-cell leukemia transcription factor-interacting protein 1 isoform X2 n=1 Tax=Lepisosteus oculatus TaxID=7918 RepID=UPI0037202D8D
MDDNSNSGGSTNGSSNNWTILTPEDSVVENVGPGDDGTDGPPVADHSSAEELKETAEEEEEEAGIAGLRAGETRSAEGLQVCQEMATGNSESSPSPGPDSNVVTVPASSPQEEEGHQEEGEGPGLSRKVDEIGKQAVRLVAPLLRGLTLSGFRRWGKRLIGRGGRAESDSDPETGAGLRRRKTHHLGRGEEEEEEEEEEDQEEERAWRKEGEGGLGLSLNKCIVGALLLLGLGMILFSGLDEEVDLRELHEKDLYGQQDETGPAPDPRSAQLMASLLDKLAQENQQITLLQAELQAQKEELALALRGLEEGGGLAQENERLRAELASLPSLQGELESLKARVTELTQITEAHSAAPVPNLTVQNVSTAPPTDEPGHRNDTPSQESPVAGEAEESAGGGDALQQELERQRLLLAESRRRLEGLTGAARERGGKRGVREGLAELERRLSAEIERLGKGAPGERREEGGQKRRWEEAERGARREGEAGKRRRKEEEEEQQRAGKEGKEGWGEQEWERGGEEKQGRKEGKRPGERGWKEGEQRGRRERKEGEERGRKEGEERGRRERKEGEERGRRERKEGEWLRQKTEQTEEGMTKDKARAQKKERPEPRSKQDHHWQGPGRAAPSPGKPAHRHHDHNAFWKQQGERLRHYRPLQGCGGPRDCARREGLHPVELPAFQALLGGYLRRLGGGAGPAELQRLTLDFFQDGLFAHQRMSFRDFAEDVGEILEELAEREGGGEGEGEELERFMEGFEREALRRFAIPGHGHRHGEREREGRRRGRKPSPAEPDHSQEQQRPPVEQDWHARSKEKHRWAEPAGGSE